MSQEFFTIHLGPRWRAFADEREGMTFLGIVQRGIAGIGALARMSDGGYAQVNGDIVEVLNAHGIKRALRWQSDKVKTESTKHQGENRPLAVQQERARAIVTSNATPDASAPSTAAPVVIVKKRRAPVCAAADAVPASKLAHIKHLALEEPHAGIRLGR